MNQMYENSIVTKCLNDDEPASYLNSTQLVPRFVLYGKCGTSRKYTENAVVATTPILLQYRRYRDWYRTTAFSVDPFWPRFWLRVWNVGFVNCSRTQVPIKNWVMFANSLKSPRRQAGSSSVPSSSFRKKDKWCLKPYHVSLHINQKGL